MKVIKTIMNISTILHKYIDFPTNIIECNIITSLI